MERKKLIRWAVFIFAIIFALILVENSIRGIGYLVEKKKENDKKEEQLEIYQTTEKYKDTVILEDIVSDLVEILNNNDIEKLYGLIDADYRDYKFQNQKELFEEYIKTYINNDSKISLQTYKKISERFVCRLLSEYDGDLKSFVALIKPIEETDSYSVIFDNIISIEKLNKTIKNNNLECNIIYNVTAKNSVTYTVEFKNLGNKDIKYNLKNIILRDTSSNIFEANEKNLELLIKSGESVRYNVTFTSEKVQSFPKTTIEFNLFNENNEERDISVYIEEIM